MEDFIDSELDILAGFGEDEKRNNNTSEDDVDAVAYDRYDDEDTF